MKPYRNPIDFPGWAKSRRTNSILTFMIATTSIFFILLFLYVAIRRMKYPFDLEWVESGVLVQVARLCSHKPLYAAPSFEYVPYLYAPLYFYLCALVAKITGVTFFTLRLVSTVSSLGTIFVLYSFVFRETHNRLASIAAVGLYASLYAFVGAWFDIGRVDSLFLFFFITALFSTRFAPPAVAAVAWVLAFQTKQSSLLFAIPLLLTYWNSRRKSQVLIALGTYLLVGWGSILLFGALNGGWYKFYIFGATAGLPGVARMAALYVPEVILDPLRVVVMFIIAALLLAPPSMKLRATQFYLVGSVTLFFGMWYVHAHRGAGNSMQALYLWVAVVFGISLHRLLTYADSAEFVNHWKSAFANILLFGVLIQLGSQLYGPGQFLPNSEEKAARERLIAQIRSIPGEVYLTNHPWDAVLAGKSPNAEGEAIGAVVDAGGAGRDMIVQEVRSAIVEKRVAAIIVDGGYTSYQKWLTPQELALYPVQIPAEGANLPRFLTSQPTAILLPCSALNDGLAKRIDPEEAPKDVVASGGCF